MANSVNSVVIVGNLTRDPEMQHTAGGTAVCTLGVAVNGSEKDPGSGEWVDRADFFDVKTFGDLAENCGQYLTRGRPVGVSGRLRQERWKTQADENRSRVVIVARDVQFLPSKHDDNGEAQQQTQRQPEEDLGF